MRKSTPKLPPGPIEAAATCESAQVYLSVEDVAERLGVAVITVRRWVRSGQLHAVQPGGKGGRILITEEALRSMQAAAVAVEPNQKSLQSPMPDERGERSRRKGPLPDWMKIRGGI